MCQMLDVKYQIVYFIWQLNMVGGQEILCFYGFLCGKSRSLTSILCATTFSLCTWPHGLCADPLGAYLHPVRVCAPLRVVGYLTGVCAHPAIGKVDRLYSLYLLATFYLNLWGQQSGQQEQGMCKITTKQNSQVN